MKAFLRLVLTLTCFFTLLQSEKANGQTPLPSVSRTTLSEAALRRLPVIDSSDIRFSKLSTAQGLSQTRAVQIVEDNQGFIWLGTQYGLDRYDGYEYKVFVHDPARENSLNCVEIFSLFKDRSGTLWVGCDSSLDKFDSVTETFTHYQIKTEPKGAGSAVQQISEDRAGLL